MRAGRLALNRLVAPPPEPHHPQHQRCQHHAQQRPRTRASQRRVAVNRQARAMDHYQIHRQYQPQQPGRSPQQGFQNTQEHGSNIRKVEG